MKDEDLDALLGESMEYMHRAIEECNRQWDFQGYRNWTVSQDTGVLTFRDGPRPGIACTFQVAGTFIATRKVWRWSWANPSIDEHLRADLEKVRRFGQENGITEITDDVWEAAGEEAAWAMTALAARLLGAKSVYRAPEGPLYVYLLITGVSWAGEQQGGGGRLSAP